MNPLVDTVIIRRWRTCRRSRVILFLRLWILPRHLIVLEANDIVEEVERNGHRLRHLRTPIIVIGEARLGVEHLGLKLRLLSSRRRVQSPLDDTQARRVDIITHSGVEGMGMGTRSTRVPSLRVRLRKLLRPI